MSNENFMVDSIHMYKVYNENIKNDNPILIREV